MDRADEIARMLFDSLKTPWVDGDMLEVKDQYGMVSSDVDKIAAALRSYGDERIEEAALLACQSKASADPIEIAFKIRALKTKSEPGEGKATK